MIRGWVAFMLRKTIFRKSFVQLNHFLSLITLAKMDAALISCTRLSPLITACEGIGNSGQRLPSIKTYSGIMDKPATALHS